MLCAKLGESREKRTYYFIKNISKEGLTPKKTLKKCPDAELRIQPMRYIATFASQKIEYILNNRKGKQL